MPTSPSTHRPLLPSPRTADTPMTLHRDADIAAALLAAHRAPVAFAERDARDARLGARTVITARHRKPGPPCASLTGPAAAFTAICAVKASADVVTLAAVRAASVTR